MYNIKLAYIGGGSKEWARVFMNDLAVADGMTGEIALYDIDMDAARRNQAIGRRINAHANTKSLWNYVVYDNIDSALSSADFVVLSILPGTFDEMAIDVHAPEKYGIYQAVGDTVGPGGILRSMRTVPLYEEFAQAISEHCPNAWVINFTNPMSICTKTLYDVFPQIKAFGCCHEVFHAQDFLACVAKEMLGVERPNRHDIMIDASGVNHFTWITKARYKDADLLAVLGQFADKYYETGYCERPGVLPQDYRSDVFLYGNKVKMDLFNRYGILGAAGDRHLVEFVNNSWYLSDNNTLDKWQFHLTSVDFRKQQQLQRIARSIRLAEGSEDVVVAKSDEEAVELIKAILGQGKIVSNVNMPNYGQMPDMPLGAVVETNCVFDKDSVTPIQCEVLPVAVSNLVYRNAQNIETTYSGIKSRNLEEIFRAFVNQPLLSTLSIQQCRSLFGEMMSGTRAYLDKYYDIDSFVRDNKG